MNKIMAHIAKAFDELTESEKTELIAILSDLKKTGRSYIIKSHDLGYVASWQSETCPFCGK